MRRSPYGACSPRDGISVASTDTSSEKGCMGRRVMLTIVVASLTLMLALAGGPAAAAAIKRLPIQAGPHGASRAPGAAIDIHPRWDPVNVSFDAAVIHLASPINGIAPVQLVTPGVDALERPGTLATVTGWGNTIQQPAGPGGGGVNYPDRMREAKVPMVSRPECQTVYANVDAPIDATMLCAGRTNLDTCQGDSGGPLFFKAVCPLYIQVGITSWGIG